MNDELGPELVIASSIHHASFIVQHFPSDLSAFDRPSPGASQHGDRGLHSCETRVAREAALVSEVDLLRDDRDLQQSEHVVEEHA